MTTQSKDMSEETATQRPRAPRNVGTLDRVVSALAGLGVIAAGAWRVSRNPWRAAIALAAAPLLVRAARGKSYLYRLLKLNTTRQAAEDHPGAEPELSEFVEASETIHVDPGDLYDFWKQFENLPRFMVHLESVTRLPGGGWKWIAKAPAGASVEWEADVTQDIPGRTIAWRSRPGSQIANEGVVEFTEAPGDRGTELRVRLMYEPPAGQLGVVVARMFGEEPRQQIRDDLARLKRLIEVGDIPLVFHGQARGEQAEQGARTS